MRRLDVEGRLATTWPTFKMMHGYFGACVSGHKAFAFPSPEPCTRVCGIGCLAYYLPRRCGQLRAGVMMEQFAWARRQQDLFAEYAGIVVASEHMRREYLRYEIPPDDVHTIPLFTVPPVAVPPANASGPRADVVFLGRLTPLKGGRRARSRHRARGQTCSAAPCMPCLPETDRNASACSGSRTGSAATVAFSLEFPGWVNDGGARADSRAGVAGRRFPASGPSRSDWSVSRRRTSACPPSPSTSAESGSGSRTTSTDGWSVTTAARPRSARPSPACLAIPPSMRACPRAPVRRRRDSPPTRTFPGLNRFSGGDARSPRAPRDLAPADRRIPARLRRRWRLRVGSRARARRGRRHGPRLDRGVACGRGRHAGPGITDPPAAGLVRAAVSRGRWTRPSARPPASSCCSTSPTRSARAAPTCRSAAGCAACTRPAPMSGSCSTSPYFYFTLRRPWRNALAIVQRTMAATLLQAASTIYMSTETWQRYLEAVGTLPRAATLPIPSSIPNGAAAEDVAQHQARISRGNARRRALRHLRRARRSGAVRAAAGDRRAGADRAVRVHGGGKPRVSRASRRASCRRIASRAWASGRLPATELSAVLKSCDLLIQPYPDGITTRRTSVMAGLCSGVATVRRPARSPNRSGRTPAPSRSPPVSDRAAFARTVARLLDDPDARRLQAAQGAHALPRVISQCAHDRRAARVPGRSA